jgi:hypothetical protein
MYQFVCFDSFLFVGLSYHPANLALFFDKAKTFSVFYK